MAKNFKSLKKIVYDFIYERQTMRAYNDYLPTKTTWQIIFNKVRPYGYTKFELNQALRSFYAEGIIFLSNGNYRVTKRI